MNDSNNNPFNIVGQAAPIIVKAENEISPDERQVESNPADLKSFIDKIVNDNQTVVFMKGNAEVPQCGFSANTTAILKHLGVEFKSFDILQDPEIRQFMKEYSNWPTFPQVYFKGQLLGGNDILTEMFQSGELEQTFKA